MINKSIYKSLRDCSLKAYYEKKKIQKTNENETYLVFYNYQKLKSLAMAWMKKHYIFYDISSNAKYFNDKIQLTQTKMQEGKVTCIANACFSNESIQGMIDFVIKAPDGMRWSLVMVKSAEDIKENIGVDAAYAKALIGDKFVLDKIYTISVNKDYIKNGKINNVRDLITISSKFDGKELIDYADEFLVDLRKCSMFDLSPNKPSFKGCKNCKYCEWRDACVKQGFLPEYGTLDIIYGKDIAYKYFNEGKKFIKDVPYDEEFDLRQTVQIYCEKNPNLFVFEPKRIKNFLKNLKEPYHFMDFEALNTMIPRVDGTHPFEFVPYQYSLHQTMKDLKVYNHDEFLSFDADCRKEFLDKLLNSLGTEGSIIVWNQDFEQSRLNELAEQFPEYRERIDALESRYFDLMVPFEKLWLYKREMYGKYSLKYVFPSLSQIKSYHDLNVKNGLETMVLYFKILKGEERAEDHRQDMLDYCGLDTESMIYILDEVQKLIKTATPSQYVSLDAVKKEVREEQLNRRFKKTKIPVITNNIINNLLQDVPDDEIEYQGYNIVRDFMNKYLIKDYVPNDKSDEITMADISYYWNNLPVETLNMNGNTMSQNKILNLVRVSRFATINPDTSNILKMGTVLKVHKAKQAKEQKKQEKAIEEKELKENLIDKKDEEIFDLDINTLDVNNPDIDINEIEALIESINIPTPQEVQEYESMEDMLEQFKK